MYTIKNFFETLWNVLQSITVLDIIDILILAYLIYLLIKLIKETKAGQLLKGIIFVVIAYAISSFIGLKAMTYIIKSALDIGILALLITFQPEIRRALEKAGRTKIGRELFFINYADDLIKKWEDAVNAICDACIDLSVTKTGALIVIERQTLLDEQIEDKSTTPLNAVPSKELFENIFFRNAPLHDGAVIMRRGIIIAAGCHLPMPERQGLIEKKLGSRHRAAIGMSESSDALVVVVSEETGQISVAENGELIRDYDREKLYERLSEDVIPKPVEPKKKSPKKNKQSKGIKK